MFDKFEQKFFTTLSQALDYTYIYLTNIATGDARWSQNAVEFFGLPNEYMHDPLRYWLPKIHPDYREAYLADIERVLTGKQDTHNFKYPVQNKDGEYIWVSCRGSISRNAEGAPLFFAGIMRRLDVQNQYDNLTGLATSKSFYDYDFTKGTTGVLLFDIDKFSEFNTTYSYYTGDRVLHDFALNLAQHLPQDDIFIRDQTDKFMLLVPNCTKTELRERFHLAQQTLQQLPYHFDFHLTGGGLLVGAGTLPSDRIKDILNLTLQHAKRFQRGQLVFYSEAIIQQLQAERPGYHPPQDHALLAGVLGCLSSLHIAVHHVNLVHNFLTEININSSYKNCMTGTFTEKIAIICRNLVSPQDYQSMRDFLDPTTLSKRLQDKPFISLDYRNMHDIWRQAVLIPSERDSKGRLVSLLYLTTDINEEKCKALAEQKVLQEALDKQQQYLQFLLEERQSKHHYQEKSQRDAMTELYNKNYFFEQAQLYLDTHGDKSSALIFLDIDNFKAVNDILGHLTGDQVIRQVAEIMRTAFANKDLLCRYGGDEFCIFMKDISEAKLQDKLKFLTQKLSFPASNGSATQQITCSLGAVFRMSVSTENAILSLVKTADKALYASKQNGKNTYTLAYL